MYEIDKQKLDGLINSGQYGQIDLIIRQICEWDLHQFISRGALVEIVKYLYEENKKLDNRYERLWDNLMRLKREA